VRITDEELANKGASWGFRSPSRPPLKVVHERTQLADVVLKNYLKRTRARWKDSYSRNREKMKANSQ
jgi:hypothetical protein